MPQRFIIKEIFTAFLVYDNFIKIRLILQNSVRQRKAGYRKYIRKEK